MSTFVFKGDSFSYSDPLYPTYEWYTGINTSNTPLTAYQAPGTEMSATTIYVSCPIQYALYEHDLEVWVNNTYDRTVKVTSGAYYTILTSTAPSGVRYIYFSKSGMQSSQSVYRVILNDGYTVSYNMHGHGTAPSSSITEKGKTLTSSQLPNRTATGWHFDGWYTNSSYTTPATTSTVVNGNMTLHAKWTQMYKVSFNSNGGSSVSSEWVIQGGTATRPSNPTRTKYQFDNWYSDSELTTVYNFNTAVTQNITLYAKWIPYYTVRFDSMGGSTVASQEVLQGNTATRPASNPTKSGGAQFDNWYTSSSYTTVFNFSTPITGPTTIYARWFDFGLANVKKWFIPEGEVKQVVWNNVVLWQRKVLTSITLSGQTTALNRGATFNFGGTVTAHYSNGETANVTSSTTFSGYNMSKAGTYTVTASYTENSVTKTATYSLTVNKAWSQLWSGSKNCKIVVGTTSGTGNVCYTAKSTGYSPQLRITFSTLSCTGGIDYGSYYIKNGSTNTSKPSSPYSATPSVGTSALKFLGAERRSTDDSSDYNRAYVKLTRDTSNNRVLVALAAEKGSYTPSSGVTSQITITKVEQYY